MLLAICLYLLTNCFVSTYKLLCICLRSALYLLTNWFVSAYELLYIWYWRTLYLFFLDLLAIWLYLTILWSHQIPFIKFPLVIKSSSLTTTKPYISIQHSQQRSTNCLNNISPIMWSLYMYMFHVNFILFKDNDHICLRIYIHVWLRLHIYVFTYKSSLL